MTTTQDLIAQLHKNAHHHIDGQMAGLMDEAADALESLQAEIKRLRELATVCYVGLGAECNLPENWLDTLTAASEGRGFSTDGLLPFTLELDDAQPSQAIEPGTRKDRATEFDCPVEPSQALPLDLLERLSKTLTRLGYATTEGGMEHFNADLASQLYSLCRGVEKIFDRAQPSQAAELSDKEILDLMPSEISAKYDGHLETFARAVIAAINAKAAAPSTKEKAE